MAVFSLVVGTVHNIPQGSMYGMRFNQMYVNIPYMVPMGNGNHAPTTAYRFWRKIERCSVAGWLTCPCSQKKTAFEVKDLCFPASLVQGAPRIQL